MHNALTNFEQTYYNIHKTYPSKEHVLKYFRFSSTLNLKEKYISLSNTKQNKISIYILCRMAAPLWCGLGMPFPKQSWY